MWWYRDRKDDPKAGASSPASSNALPVNAPPGLRADVLSAVRDALAGREADPDAWLLMSLLVDGVLETASGPPVSGLPVQDAERYVVEAWSRRAGAQADETPLRLYNRFTRNFGEGYSTRTDVPEPHRAALEALRNALSSAPGVLSYRAR